MQATKQPSRNYAGKGSCAQPITIHWNDAPRREQVTRLRTLQPQSCDDEAHRLWERMDEQARMLPDGVRLDIPSARLISRLLGIFRTAATLKDRPMLVLELSAKELARVANYSKSQVETALRWLGVGEITFRGKVVAMGLGVIERTLRKGKITIGGALRGVFRTSATGLTATGRRLLGLMRSAAPTGRRETDPKVMRREKRAVRLADCRRALAQISASLRAFRDDVLPEPLPVEDAFDDPAMSHTTRVFMERARALMGRRRIAT